MNGASRGRVRYNFQAILQTLTSTIPNFLLFVTKVSACCLLLLMMNIVVPVISQNVNYAESETTGIITVNHKKLPVIYNH